MVFTRIAEFVSSATSRSSASKSSTVPYTSSEVPPLVDSVQDSSFSRYGQKNNFRHFSSLQDLSAYHQLDPEEGDLNPGMERILAHPKQPHLLARENGATFSKEKASPAISFVHRKWVRVIMVLLCLLLLAFFIVMLIFIYSNWSQGASKFYVVLDCGSTGTRVHIHQAFFNHKKDDNLPFLLRSLPEGLDRKPSAHNGRAYNRMETEPGLDKLVHNSSGLRGALKPLLRWAEKQIPVHAHKSTSLFLYATAGVRRLPSSDSEWLLTNAWSILKTSPFLCQREWVKIISGIDEAFYGWIALNYHTGVLGVAPKQSTFGALDLGGSSLQVTFESKEHVHNETTLKLSIGRANHRLSAYSLSGYGLNDAFDKSVVRLLKRLPRVTNSDLLSGNVEIKHPCLNSGYRQEYFCSRCASVYQEGGGSPIGGKNFSKGGKPGISLQLIGAPKWDECSALAQVAVNLSEWSDLNPGIDCELQPCAIPDNLPRPYGQFYAMSGFYVVYRFFKLTSDAALDDVLEKGQEFCEKTWDIAKNSVTPQPFIEQYCFRAPYIVFLLREGLHITDSHVTIGSGSITWTLGVALLEAGKRFPTRLEFYNYEILRMKINPYFLLAILFVSLVLLVCAISCVGNGMRRFFTRSYLPLSRHNNASTSVLNLPNPFLRFQHWSVISSGDGRVKMPLSPIANAQQRPFGMGGSTIQLTESSLYPSPSSVAHSYSSGNLGQMQLDNSSMGSFWTPHRSQMSLQSRRSQSREDLSSSLAESHVVKI